MRVTCTILTCFLTTAILAASSISSSEKKKLVFGAISGSVNDKIATAILAEAYKRLGINVKFKIYPSKRSLYEANGGFTDGEVMRIKGIEKRFKNLIPVRVPVHILWGSAYTKIKNLTIKNRKDLKPYKIGILRGIIYSEKYTRGLTRIKASTTEQLVDLLVAGRVDVIILDPRDIEYYIKKKRLKSIRKIVPPLVTLKLYHYLHKRNKRLVPEVENILRKMYRTGAINRIRNRVLREVQK